MTHKTKILILGIGQSNFLDQLYGGMAECSDQFVFDIDGYTEISTQISSDKKHLYNQHFNFKAQVVPKSELLFAFLAFALTGFFWQILFFELSQRQRLHRVIHQLKKYARAKYDYARLIKPGGYDVIHFHFCTPDNLSYLHFFNANEKAICSFWGSDLMRLTGTSNVFYVSKALAKSTAITIQSDEMAEMLYCKYGRDLRPKVQALRFTLHPEIYAAIDQQRSADSIVQFKQKHNIASERTIVAVGHNAFEENNHIAILKQMEQLPAIWRTKLTFVLHVSYGGKPAYIRRLSELATSSKDIEIKLIDTFLGAQDMAQFRTASRVMIHMPISDALSGAMTETLYAGNMVLAGAWLPYGILRRQGITFTEVESFNDLPVLLTGVLENLAATKQPNVANAERIRSFLFPDTTSNAWIQLLKTVANG